MVVWNIQKDDAAYVVQSNDKSTNIIYILKKLQCKGSKMQYLL